ncbi:MAG: dipeptide/oligopeptide/nickel ABC transporter permease/ATP-binding protein [bacterium]|nr:dipeptide/oligopeptide/nickel ABC transporter permease/ATP-binding protein [bacterium]
MIARSPMTAIGLIMLLAAIGAAVLAPVVAPIDHTASGVYVPPGADHWLGTDDGGQDVFSLFLHGARISLVIGCFATLISVVAGGTIGLLSGYFGGRVENTLMRVTDIFLVIPDLPLIIALVAVIGPSVFNIIFAIGLVGWTGSARLIRAQTLAVKNRKFVTRARALGASHSRIILRHILPQVAPLLCANTILVLSLAILNESTLSFLGLGDAATISWGQALHIAFTRGAMSAGAWWALLVPGFGIAWVVLGCALLGHGLEDIFSPRARFHHLTPGPAPTPTAGPLPKDANTVLTVRNLEIDYILPDGPLARAVDGVSFELQRGEILGIVGESGCGKSTLLLSLLRLLPARAQIAGGSIHLGPRELLALSETEMADVRGKALSIVFQGAMNALNPVHTVGAQIAEAIGRNHPGMTRPALETRVGEILQKVGVPTDRRTQYPHQFSGGMRQRAMIAMALACNPTILCADEPTTALDGINQAQVLDLLDDLRETLGLSIILVTHDLGVVARTCDRVLVLYGGTIAETGTVDNIFHNPMHPYTRELIRATPDLTQPDRLLATIPGTPPRLDNLPLGCRFAPRCAQAITQCHTERPNLRGQVAAHQASCHLLEILPS